MVVPRTSPRWVRFSKFGEGHGAGVHDLIIEEIELSERVSLALDDENNCGWSAIDTLCYLEYMRQQEDTNG